MPELRDALEAGFAAAEQPAEKVEAVVEAPAVVEPVEVKVEEGRARGPDGKFLPKTEVEAKAAVEQPKTELQPPPVRPARPSSWKKDYWEHWDKLDPKLAEYVAQREKEFTTGVSTYKAEAENAKQITEALAPFIPELQKHNIQPTQWITNLGNAHRTLALGNPEQKLQMFAKLAADYGVPLQALTGQQVDPQQSYLMQQLNELRGAVTGFMGQQEQQQQAAIKAEIDKFEADTEKHPHFAQVRETMGRLLESGVAPDLETAYQKAVWMSDDTRSDLLAKQQKSEQEKAQQIAQEAKAKAVSVKSSTPRGVTNGSGTKDRRSVIAEQFESLGAGRL